MNNVPAAEAVKIALRHKKTGHYHQAEPICRELVQAFPGEAAYHEMLMEILYLQRRFDESIAAFRYFTSLQPDNGDAEYESSYLRALRATTSRPWPVKRRLRFRTLVRLLMDTDSLNGDIAECGCFMGLSSYLMCDYLRTRSANYRGARHHIFDSFEGLSAPTLEDDVPEEFERAKRIKAMCAQGAFAASLHQVRHNLADFPDITFHPGWIPLTFQGLPERKYRFVHIDVDLYDPTLESFEYFYPRLAAGGVLVSDDYGWPGARKAIDEFCAERSLQLAVTAFQQAVLSKLR